MNGFVYLRSKYVFDSMEQHIRLCFFIMREVSKNALLDQQAWALLSRHSAYAFIHDDLPLSPVIFATHGGVKARMFTANHGLHTLTPEALFLLGIDPHTHDLLIRAGGNAEKQYKNLSDTGLVAPYTHEGIPRPVAIAVAKLKGLLHACFESGLNLFDASYRTFPAIKGTDWVYGIGNKIKEEDGLTSFVRFSPIITPAVEWMVNQPNTPEDLEEVFGYYTDGIRHIYSLHGQAVFIPGTRVIRAGISVADLGEFTQDGEVIEKEKERALNEGIGVRAGGIHIPDALRNGLIIPGSGRLFLFRQEFGPVGMDQAERISMAKPTPVSHTEPVFSYYVNLTSTPDGRGIRMTDEDALHVERGVVDIPYLLPDGS